LIANWYKNKTKQKTMSTKTITTEKGKSPKQNNILCYNNKKIGQIGHKERRDYHVCPLLTVPVLPTLALCLLHYCSIGRTTGRPGNGSCG